MKKQPVRRINGRVLSQAYGNAGRIRDELPHLIQPSNSDLDLVLLLEEIQGQEEQIGQLCALIQQYRLKLEQINEIARI